MANQLLQQQLLQEISRIIIKIDYLSKYIYDTAQLFVSGTPIEIIERLKITNIKVLELQKMIPDILSSYLMIPTISETQNISFNDGDDTNNIRKINQMKEAKFNDDLRKIDQMTKKQNYKAKLLDQNLEEMHNQSFTKIYILVLIAMNDVDKNSIPEKIEMLETKKNQYNSLLDSMLEFK